MIRLPGDGLIQPRQVRPFLRHRLTQDAAVSVPGEAAAGFQLVQPQCRQAGQVIALEQVILLVDGRRQQGAAHDIGSNHEKSS